MSTMRRPADRQARQPDPSRRSQRLTAPASTGSPPTVHHRSADPQGHRLRGHHRSRRPRRRRRPAVEIRRRAHRPASGIPHHTRRSMRSAPISAMAAASCISAATASTGRWCRMRAGPWAFELRRAEGGIRLWETLPGESYHAFDGSYGGLWRRLGRPPQALVGVGFSTQGRVQGFPLHLPRRHPRSARRLHARGDRGSWRGPAASLASAASWAAARPAMSSTAPTRALARRIMPSSSAAPSLTTRPISPSTKSVTTTPGRPRVRRSSAPT